MGEVINLNRFRKARAKAIEAKQADENRVQFGRTKMEKSQATTKQERADTDLDGKKLT